MFYLIDKPVGMSSFDVIRRLRKLTGIKKMGHTGTLDPLASGCLLIATENSTKLISRLEEVDKRYVFCVDISKTSPSLDLWTDTTTVDTSSMNIPTFHTLIDFLEKQTSQVPPIYSALHIDGKRAYVRARSGEAFTLPKRSIRLSDIVVHAIHPPSLSIELTINSGGYIRSLAPTIANFCGVEGWGCITELRRIRIGGLSVSESQKLETFDREKSIPYESLFPYIETVIISSRESENIKNGKVIASDSSHYTLWKEYFLLCDGVLSLAKMMNDGWHITRNFV